MPESANTPDAFPPEQFELIAFCDACGHSASIDRARIPPGLTIPELPARLREQALKGYRGWDDPAQYERIVEMMMQHAAVGEGEEVDAANLAMILWSLRRQR